MARVLRITGAALALAVIVPTALVCLCCVGFFATILFHEELGLPLSQLISKN